jgi:hypothetical protein
MQRPAKLLCVVLSPGASSSTRSSTSPCPTAPARSSGSRGSRAPMARATPCFLSLSALLILAPARGAASPLLVGLQRPQLPSLLLSSPRLPSSTRHCKPCSLAVGFPSARPSSPRPLPAAAHDPQLLCSLGAQASSRRCPAYSPSRPWPHAACLP